MTEQLEIVVSSRNGHSWTKSYDLPEGLDPKDCANYLSERLNSDKMSYEVVIQIGDVAAMELLSIGKSEKDAVRLATAKSYVKMQRLIDDQKELKGNSIERHLRRVAWDPRIQRRNPPTREMFRREDKQKTYEELISHPDWVRVGMIPAPKSRFGWFIFHMAHGLIMRYPVRAVVAFSLLHMIHSVRREL